MRVAFKKNPEKTEVLKVQEVTEQVSHMHLGVWGGNLCFVSF